MTTTTVKKPNRRRKILRYILVLGLAFLAVVFFFGFYINSYGRIDQSIGEKFDVIIVLGAKVQPWNNTSMVERTRRGAELYKNGQAEYLLVTGGQGSDEDRSEAAAMAEIAQRFGVPKDRIILEDKSRNTRENAIFSAHICRERNWNKVVIVSDTFHLWRAQRNFQHENLTTYTCPALQSDPSRHWYECAPMLVREEVAILRDMVVKQ
ncbi:MAG: YdcF family protein [bacterium]